MSTKITSKNFEDEIIKSDLPVIIDFWAAWCGPCRMLSPVIEELAEEKKGEIKVCKVNIDEEPELARKFNVMSIPTLVAIKGGKVTNVQVGVKSKQAIADMVKA